MDLRPHTLTQLQLDHVKSLVIEGLISYQPFIFSDDLEVGVGYEFEEGRFAGLVYFPDIPQELLSSPELARRVLPVDERQSFHEANRRLAAFYDTLVNQIASEVGGVVSNSFLDVGCNNGYISLSFSLLGAASAIGYDRQDFSKVFDLFNSILESNARFVHAWYDPTKHALTNLDAFDVVTSMAMVCHVSDPLHLLSSLGKIARKALFVWTLVSEDDSNVIHYGDPRGDYPTDLFPFCFDNLTVLSVPLLRKSMELMGFSRIIELPLGENIPKYSWKGYSFRGFLAIR